ncbi:MAG: amidophosphoribosyltransferase [Deltaproteobacteria bacterium]|nr:amidophosphoribosyltransferase [Deltaproteobacteria bacterium]MBW2537278.1 amidophosphoribosyltransferase [Deltaproteobacteria bacterium]
MCGIFGIYGHPEAANIAYLGLHGLQHRGQESAGLVTTDGEHMAVHRAMGLVQAGFSSSELERLRGSIAVGHVRYSTAGASHIRNAQPFAFDYHGGSVAIAHNGNLTNHEPLRQRLEARGSIFQTNSDTEAIVHLLAISEKATLPERVVDALSQVEGAFSLLLMDERSLIAVRDPRGFRPLCLGILPHAGEQGDPRPRPAYVVSSEPTSFDLIGAERLRDVEPGEMVVIDEGGVASSRPFETRRRRMCLFEYVYFARPDAVLDATSVYEVRKACGRRLFDEHPVEPGAAADVVVVPVPDSGVPAAVGLAAHAGVPFEMGLIRSHYVGRTFIEPQQSIRHFGVRLKLNPNAAALRGKRVIVVDDSIVRGTTSRKLVGMLRAAGAAEVHVRISSPPTQWPCYYGIDTPTRRELIAANHSVEEIRRFLTADSLGYLSLRGLVESVWECERQANPSRVGASREGYCHACFSGEYPVELERAAQRQLRLVNG